MSDRLFPFEFTPGTRALGIARRPGPEAADLFLDGNEGLRADFQDVARALVDAELLRRYPETRPLERKLASRFGVSPDRVIVTAGADEGLDRLMRVAASPGRGVVMPGPTFEMLPRYAILSGADTAMIPWPDGPFPIDQVISAITPKTAIAFFVTPQNPTGAHATADDLDRLAAALPHGIVVCDFAYAEYTDHDLTAHALEKPNTIVFRTFSKAWGLAGARVGYAIGPVNILNAMRAAGSPFAANGLGLHLAAYALEHGEAAMRRHVAQVRVERTALCGLVRRLGGDAPPSEGNFVLARFTESRAIRADLLRQGIAVREWPARPELSGALRITCPGRSADFVRLADALTAAVQRANCRS